MIPDLMRIATRLAGWSWIWIPGWDFLALLVIYRIRLGWKEEFFGEKISELG
jgi:hypothetical protein